MGVQKLGLADTISKLLVQPTKQMFSWQYLKKTILPEVVKFFFNSDTIVFNEYRLDIGVRLQLEISFDEVLVNVEQVEVWKFFHHLQTKWHKISLIKIR